MTMVTINPPKGVARKPIAYAGRVSGMYFPLKDGSNRWVFVNSNGGAAIQSSLAFGQRPVYKGDTIEWTFEGN